MKRRAQVILPLCVVFAASIISIGLIRSERASTKSTVDKPAMIRSRDGSVVKLLAEKSIRMVESWDVGDASLLCVVQKFHYDPQYEGRGQRLTIYDQSGVVLREDYFSSIDRMYLASPLRTEGSQLIVEANFGGNTTDFLQMLDYRDGKVIEVPINGDTDFNAGAEVRPQFRRGIAPAKEAYQIMLTEGVGLASPVEKVTRVYRYEDGSYHFVGRFNQRDVDDYIEKLITEDKSRKSTKPSSAEASTRRGRN